MSSRTTTPPQLSLHSRPPRKSNSKQKLLSQVAKHTSQPAKKCSRSKLVKRRHLRRSRPLPRLRKKKRRGTKPRRRRRLRSHIRSFKKSMVVSMVPRTLATTIPSWMHISRRTFTPLTMISISLLTSLSYKLILKNKRRIDSCFKSIETTCSLRKSRRIEVKVIITISYILRPKNLANSSIYLRS
jgi:hypothetical protein